MENTATGLLPAAPANVIHSGGKGDTQQMEGPSETLSQLSMSSSSFLPLDWWFCCDSSWEENKKSLDLFAKGISVDLGRDNNTLSLKRKLTVDFLRCCCCQTAPSSQAFASSKSRHDNNGAIINPLSFLFWTVEFEERILILTKSEAKMCHILEPIVAHQSKTLPTQVKTDVLRCNC